MTRRLVGLAATLAVAALATACNEAPSTAPQVGDPSFVMGTSSNACVFTGNPSLSNASNTYFTVSSDKNAASTLINGIQAGFTASGFNSATAKEKGFDLLSLAGKVSRAGTGSSPIDGAELVRQTIQCMFDVVTNSDEGEDFFGWPADDQFDFATALTPAGGGAFAVRGGPADSATYPVIAHGSTGNISAIQPAGTATWPNAASNRVLVYGEPVTGGYDWKLIPRATTFTPSAVVALCQAVQPPGGFKDDDMIHQESVGVIGFVGAQAATMCGMTQSVALNGGPLGSFALLGRLVRLADRLLAPQPLYASAVLLSSTIGGSASGAKGDAFVFENVPAVELTLTIEHFQNPLKVKTGNLGTITVKVQTPLPAPQSPVGGVTVTLSAVNNNGFTQVGEIVGGKCVPVSPKTTLATVVQGGSTPETSVSWNNGCITKTGIVSILVNAAAVGRSGGIGTTSSAKFNVKP